MKQFNDYYREFCEPFDIKNDKEIQDYNYEVDALEDEHVRREVVTTKTNHETQEVKIKEEPVEIPSSTKTKNIEEPKSDKKINFQIETKNISNKSLGKLVSASHEKK